MIRLSGVGLVVRKIAARVYHSIAEGQLKNR